MISYHKNCPDAGGEPTDCEVRVARSATTYYEYSGFIVPNQPSLSGFELDYHSEEWVECTCCGASLKAEDIASLEE